MSTLTDFSLRTHVVHEKANKSDAHQTLGPERTVLLMANQDWKSFQLTSVSLFRYN